MDDAVCPQLGLIKLVWPVTCLTFCEGDSCTILAGTKCGHVAELSMLPVHGSTDSLPMVQLKLVRSWQSALNPDQEITVVKTSPSGHYIAAATNAGGIELFDGDLTHHSWRANGHSARVQR